MLTILFTAVSLLAQTAPAPTAPPSSLYPFAGKTMPTVKDGKKAAWLHDDPDPSKWQIQCQLVYQIRSRIPKRVCATVGEWEAIGATGQWDIKEKKRKTPVVN